VGLYIAFESPLSGMSMNPARTFGSALTAGRWDGIWIYFTAPPLAALAAAAAVRALRPDLHARSSGPAALPGPRPRHRRARVMSDEFRPKADAFKAQTMPYPAKQSEMDPQPDSDLSNYRPAAS
jgi:hypothetical protein